MFPSPTRSPICHSILHSVDLKGNKSSVYHVLFPHPSQHQYALSTVENGHDGNLKSRCFGCYTLLAGPLMDGRIADIDIVFAFIKLYEFKGSRILQLEWRQKYHTLLHFFNMPNAIQTLAFYCTLLHRKVC